MENCARGRFVKIKAPFTQQAIRSASVSTILNVLMEGERNSIQHQEINKSIPFLELIHSSFLGELLANVGHRIRSIFTTLGRKRSDFREET